MPRCKAHNKQGEQCKRNAIHGGTVCYWHGGAAPQVKLKAEERLKAMIDPALTALDEVVQQKTDIPSRVRAANSVLDRAGVGVVPADPSRPTAITLNIVNIPRPPKELEP